MKYYFSTRENYCLPLQWDDGGVAGMAPSHELILANGQRTSWLQYGVPTGAPLFFNNGWPGCAAQAVYLQEQALRLGLRVISIDRPGFGRSTSQPQRGLLEWPPIVAAVADHLEIDRFALLGISGGGPYALATAWALGSRVSRVVLSCSAVPTHTPEARQGMLKAYRLLLALNDVAPWSLPLLLRIGATMARLPLPFPLLKILFRLLLPKPDAALLCDRQAFNFFQPSYVGAMQAGGAALYEDGFPYTQPWHFQVEEITTPVSLWHGTQDANFNIAQAKKLAARLQHVQFHERNEGHYSLPFNCAGEMLAVLASEAIPQASCTPSIPFVTGGAD